METNDNRHDEATDEPSETLMLTTGLLATNGSTELWQSSDGSKLLVRTPGEPDVDIPLRTKTQDGKQYVECTTSLARSSLALAALLKDRYGDNRKAIAVHQLSAIVGLGAKLVGEEKGRVAVHHLSLDPGDNRACNLAVLRTSTHDRFHVWFGRLDVESQAAYLASLAAGDRVGDLPDELRAQWLADREELEEWGMEAASDQNAFVDETGQPDEQEPTEQAERTQSGKRRYYRLQRQASVMGGANGG